MSAYVVSKTHIDLMVKLALEGPRDAPHDWRLIWWATNPTTFGTTEPGQALPSAAVLSRAATIRREASPETADATGEMLMNANVESVGHRYDEQPFENDLPGHADYLMPYRYADPGYRPTLAESVGIIAGYEYQSCEHPGWDGSEAYRFCVDLKDRLLRLIPGEHGWTWDEEDLAQAKAKLSPAVKPHGWQTIATPGARARS